MYAIESSRVATFEFVMKVVSTETNSNRPSQLYMGQLVGRLILNIQLFHKVADYFMR